MTDMLAEMKADRKKCRPIGNGLTPDACDGCGIEWPCPTARALDVAITLAERLEKEKHAPWVERLLAAAQAKWEGK